MTRPSIGQARAPLGLLVLLLGIVAALAGPGPALADTSDTETPEAESPEAETPEAETPDTEAPATDPEAEARDEALRVGAEVYSRTCSSCHQPGGTGLPGQFPPLLDNPRVDDTEYVADVIINGQRGEIEVAGVTYDGVMPPFSTLTDSETAAVIAYIQNDFQAPQAAIDAFEEAGPAAGSGLPVLASFSAIVAYLLAGTVAALVLAPRLVSVNDRLNTPWLDAWLKTAVIVCGVVLLTVVIPDLVLKTTAVSRLSRLAQDIIGSGLWALGLAAVIGGLWYAHRESRI